MTDGRWAAFVGCLYAAIATGCGYTFSIFSGALKKAFDLSQADLDTINAVSFCSGLVAFVPGMLNDRAGPKTALIVGGLAQTGSFIAYWGVATRRIQTSTPVAMMSILGATAMLGSSCITSAVFATLTRNFPKQRGEVVGIAKAWVGLCGGVLAQLYTGFVGKPDDSPGTLNVVLVQALLVFVVTVPLAPLVKLNDALNLANNLRTRLRMAYATIALVTITITAGAIFESNLSQHGLQAFAIAMCVWWSIPMLIPLSCVDDVGQRRDEQEGITEPLLSNEDPALDNRQQPSSSSSDAFDHKLSMIESSKQSVDAKKGQKLLQKQQQPTPEIGPMLMLQNLDCYLLFYVGSCLIGGGIMITMNAAQMVESAGLKRQVSPEALVSIFSVSQAVSRVLAGLGSEAALKMGAPAVRAADAGDEGGSSGCGSMARSSGGYGSMATRWCGALGGIGGGIPRPYAIMLASLFMSLGHFVLAIAASGKSSAAMFVGVAIAAFGFGAAWPLLVILVSELFGTVHLGTNYMFFDGFCSAAGTYGLAKLLPQSVYMAHSNPTAGDSGDDDSGSHSCHGAGCFRLTHLVIGAVSFSAVFVSCAVAYRTRGLYRVIRANALS
jgi:hypothetical protein